MDRELNCDFYIGDKVVNASIHLMDYHNLNGFKRKLINTKLFKNFYWQSGAISTLFKPYGNYIITGEPYCISNWFILFIAKLMGKKTYLWSHGWYGNETKLKTWIKKMFFGMAHGVFLYSECAKKNMLKNDFNKEKLHVIYNSLNHKKQLQIRNGLTKNHIYEEHFNNDYPVIIFTGRITPEKKLDLLVNAHELLNNKNIKFNVMILGDGSEKENLREFVKDKGLENYYWFYGASYEEEKIGELFYNAAVCVSPGNVGLTAIHSLMYGIPVLTHNNYCAQGPEFEAISEGITGGFFIENDIIDLANKITDWIEVLEKDKMKTRNEAYNIIDTKYNPYYQIELLKSIIHNKE